ncbi:peptidylprolyl isomerase [Pontivivens ytuae]|uniref:Peptidyl-prolyl cis-trans isomerase n=1 Tax=Pontivivens ytuae TaxID=2789856 RepID=A0A7S9LR97_9RHOB|nr:peptidylprolyl isomerase [Pontivivens ytuae]QPH53530.1 peptidylprolyl isomerase [Pontivivens ytuae]
MKRLTLALTLFAAPLAAQDNPTLVLNTSEGAVRIELLPEVAPQHVERITTLAEQGAYDGVAFHRVIEGFMAQTGDVGCGTVDATCPAGTGGSDLPDLPAEFSDISYEVGVVGMARTADPNSANSQFFIMTEAAPHLNGQYTVVGRVLDGMDAVNALEKGAGQSGAVANPDRIESASVE